MGTTTKDQERGYNQLHGEKDGIKCRSFEQLFHEGIICRETLEFTKSMGFKEMSPVQEIVIPSLIQKAQVRRARGIRFSHYSRLWCTARMLRLKLVRGLEKLSPS